MKTEDSVDFGLAQFQTALPVTTELLAERGWNVQAGDLDFPMLVIKDEAVRSNIALMADYCRSRGVLLSPHGKTTMTPWIFDQQLEAGAWAMTAATPAHCKTYRTFGIQRILLANVLVDPKAIRWAAQELDADSSFDFLCYVDSAEGVEILHSVLKDLAPGRPIGILVELGYPGGRTGCRTVEAAIELSRLVAESPYLKLRGVSGFEGFIAGKSTEAVMGQVETYLREVHKLAQSIHDRDLVSADAMIVSSGGSAYFDLVVDVLGTEQFNFPVQTVLRSGCYVSHDAEMYEPVSPLAGRSTTECAGRLQPALELWATVWSRPEPDLAIVGFGRRDAPWDFRFPLPEKVCERDSRDLRDLNGKFVVTALNDQHAYVNVPSDDPVSVGDQILLGVSHPCGAFDRWPWIPVVDKGYNVLEGVRTYF